LLLFCVVVRGSTSFFHSLDDIDEGKRYEAVCKCSDFTDACFNHRFEVSSTATVVSIVRECICLLLAAAGFPQGIATGSISGTVTDPTGATVPGAKVTVVSTATNQASIAVTSDVGFFAVHSLLRAFIK